MCSTEVTQKDLHDLLEMFEKKSYEAGPCEPLSLEHTISKKCESLYKLDYSLIELDNTNGALSPRYPGRIFIPESEHGSMVATMTNSSAATTTCHRPPFYNNAATPSAANLRNSGKFGDETDASATTQARGIHAYVSFASAQHDSQANLSNKYPQPPPPPPPAPPYQQQQQTIYEDLYDVPKIRELITMAKYARCRQRFVVPVILYRGKYICRSATISVMPETYGRKVVDYAYDCFSGTNYQDRGYNDEDNGDPTDDSLMTQINEPMPFSYDEAIKSDIQLLNALNVTTIVDLMVEKRKIKYFMAVSSSEKADPENHYENFNILSLPYPGCEFFKKFRDNNYMAKNLHYNWQKSFNDAIISIPKLGPVTDLDICWYDYKKWDLVLITQNYLKATLKYIQEESAGLLVHCISGWDRTPLFISLVRLSLWADGLIHQSLDALQMAYFTLAYDWYLFGHQLPDRLKRGEDIMFFCFHVLKYITDEEFSVVEHRKRTKTSSSSGSSSVIVIKSDFCDEEPVKEDYVLNFDQDSNDSFSNLSNCDMSITENFYGSTTTTTSATPPICNPLTNRSPNPKRSRTSPISVPGANVTRQRQESTSSNGSWQVVTDTGSIDSVMNGSYMMQFVSHMDNSVNSGNGGFFNNANGHLAYGATPGNGSVSGSTGSASSNGTGNGAVFNAGHSAGSGSAGSGGGGVGPTHQHTAKERRSPITIRKQRLNSLRAIFIQAYGKTIGLKFKEGSSMNLTTFIGTYFS